MSYPIQILRQLGAGGNGDTYIGQRPDTREFVVVKYLREPHLAHARKAFEREVRILQRKLRGIVPLISTDLASKRPYYVMPYSLGARSHSTGRLFDVQLHNAALELAQTFATLHAANIYHGDIKPDNILVSGDGTLQVADPAMSLIPIDRIGKTVNSDEIDISRAGYDRAAAYFWSFLRAQRVKAALTPLCR